MEQSDVVIPAAGSGYIALHLPHTTVKLNKYILLKMFSILEAYNNFTLQENIFSVNFTKSNQI